MTGVLPGLPARWCVAAAVSTWIGVSIGMGSWIGFACAVLGIVVATIVLPRWSWVLACFCLLGIASGLIAQSRLDAIATAALPTGRVDVSFRLAEEVSAASWGMGVGDLTSLEGQDWDGPRVAVRNLPQGISVGSMVTATGTMSKGARWVRGEVVAGTLTVEDVTDALVSRNPVVVSGNAIRSAVASRYNGESRSDGLLAGFLTGDTDRMRAVDQENLRLAGLSHFVAVSGSNVALFLVIWWFVTAPLSMHPQVRVLVGGVGLWLFAVVTRWESSVLRASAMAAVPLLGGWVGVPVDPWMALGTSVTFLLLVSGHLIGEVGFQLSVLATAGVLVGLALAKGRRHRWLMIPLLTTLGAQIAVAPLLLVVFGSVPLLSPGTNLVVAPVIAVTTVVAAVGVVVAPFATFARLGASFVLWTADVASAGPQMGWVGVISVALIGSILAIRSTRPVAVAVGIVLAVVTFTAAEPWPSTAQVTVLDVGQGDAILIQDPSGESLLFDGGSDPRVLDQALRRHGVRFVETTVVSHGDADHAGGLVELVADGRTDRLVVSRFSQAMDLVTDAKMAGVAVVTVQKGDRLQVGSVDVDVLSPGRRFASDNDGSLVLLLATPVPVLLPGDIEAVAQRELPPVRADVMVVPHHGSATTDPRWLVESLGSMAVLSYGPNRFGHPHPDIIEILEASATVVYRTDVDGDIEIPLVGS